MSDGLIDESSLVTETFEVPDGYMPKGNWWTRDGACFQAVPCPETNWRWAARNPKAMLTGYTGQELFPHMMPVLPTKAPAEGGEE